MTHRAFIEAIGLFGIAVCALSGSLAAGRRRMDVIGFILLGTVTGIGGGTVRDLLLDRTVFWTAAPGQLALPIAVSLLAFFFVPGSLERSRGLAWSDALGLAAFTVQGTDAALDSGAHLLVAVVMGVITGVGGGVIRDILSGDRPFILRGELYASAALAGAVLMAVLTRLGVPVPLEGAAGFLAVLLARGAAIVYGIRMGPPGSFLRVGAAGPGDEE